ncbi:uncharacterized protein LOC100575087 [Acyrthosiphon pisum]|uniref:Uncharacterized protein n=1 Tax=Acyrthosiphon pisum TaxID=7029 RepID=A0A8R2H8D9_ACYPI|nr:uncharacterized protein LOC100575087 [Acyrthosiphon pisum]|eukprot:XP_016658710.1 PREDICTED: uncharacterized protein LOC100575087 [Acyrthosiphon pisum]
MVTQNSPFLENANITRTRGIHVYSVSSILTFYTANILFYGGPSTLRKLTIAAARLTSHSSSSTANATAHTSFAVRTQKLTVLCFTIFLLVLQGQIWRTKWTPKSRKRHPLGHHSVLVQEAFALPRPAADQRTRFSMKPLKQKEISKQTCLQ